MGSLTSAPVRVVMTVPGARYVMPIALCNLVMSRFSGTYDMVTSPGSLRDV